MSARLFKSFNNDSSSDYLQKKCDVEKLRLNKLGNTIDLSQNQCFKIGVCNTTSIEDYNTLQKYETFYNINHNNNYDSLGNKINYFNGQMNQSSYLSLDISGSICLIKHLDPSHNDLSCNYIAPYEYGSISPNNLLFIDISGKVFDIGCNNLFYKNNNNIQYLLDLSQNIQKDIDTEIKLYDLSCNNKY